MWVNSFKKIFLAWSCSNTQLFKVHEHTQFRGQSDRQQSPPSSYIWTSRKASLFLVTAADKQRLESGSSSAWDPTQTNILFQGRCLKWILNLPDVSVWNSPRSKLLMRTHNEIGWSVPTCTLVNCYKNNNCSKDVCAFYIRQMNYSVREWNTTTRITSWHFSRKQNKLVNEKNI